MKAAVIGSGFAGISAARALIERGCAVTILDVGETLDSDRKLLVSKLKEGAITDRSKLAEWGAEADIAAESGGIPEKLHFGSDYIRGTDRSFAQTRTMQSPFPTFAKGGFSNVWGAAVLPSDACDMTDWPLSRNEMEPHFRKAAELFPLVGGGGTLERSFPTYKEAMGEIDPGPQGRLLLEDLDRAQSALLAQNTLYGRARLAVYTAATNEDVLPCNNCGECSYGCVRGAIFGVAPVLEGMIRRGEIEYRDGIFIEHVAESDGKPIVEGIDLRAESRFTSSYDALFIAAGPINTARLLLCSRNLYERRIRLKESQKFVIPILRRRAAPTTIEVPSMTLSAAFIETKVPSLSNHWVHAQVVSMNRTISDNAPLPLVRLQAGRRIWAPVLRRVMAAWCGMHSDHSSELELKLSPGHGAQPDRLTIEGRVSETARTAGRQAAKELFRKGLIFDTVFCHWMIRFSYPGRGTHCGASFPMRAKPTDEIDSDLWGRPFNWSKIFVVDATVLPSIPGTTMAFPVIANAYRIGREAPLS